MFFISVFSYSVALRFPVCRVASVDVCNYT